MTTPLGWLKAHKHAFTPSLEPRLLQAVDSISMGHLEKVYITFPALSGCPLIQPRTKSLLGTLPGSPQTTLSPLTHTNGLSRPKTSPSLNTRTLIPLSYSTCTEPSPSISPPSSTTSPPLPTTPCCALSSAPTIPAYQIMTKTT